MSEENKVTKNKNKAKKKIKAKKRKGAFLKILPVLIAVLLILIVGGAFYGQKLMEKYSYGTDKADLNEYFATESGKLAVVLNAQNITEKAKLIDGKAYFTDEFVRANITDRFYISENSGNDNDSVISALYTTHEETITCKFDKGHKVEFKNYLTGSSQVDLDYEPIVLEGETLYFALDYLKLFVPIAYDIYPDPGYIVLYTKEPEAKVATMNTDSNVRSKGGIKSPILDPVSNGEKIYVLEEMEDWAKVIDARGFIGYVEIKQFGYVDETPMLMSAAAEIEYPLEYTTIFHEGKINMAFHQIFADPAGHFGEDFAEVKSVNVVAPTIYRIDEGGEIKALPAGNYAEKAAAKGMDVWAVWTDVDSPNVDMTAILGSANTRRDIIERMISETKDNNFKGINIDFERITAEGGQAFIQFLRELSVETHKAGIILSVDNYAISAFHPQYNIAEEGKVVDYVCLMGYDENQKTIGSNASIDFVEKGIRETLQTVPANKVINIVPLYTRLWRITDENTFSVDVITMKTQQEWISQIGATPAWDNETCQNYVEAVVGGKTCRLWMEDAESLEVKLNVMDTYELAGVAEWKIGFETSDVWDVFEKYMAGTLNPEAKPKDTPAESEETPAGE